MHGRTPSWSQRHHVVPALEAVSEHQVGGGSVVGAEIEHGAAQAPIEVARGEPANVKSVECGYGAINTGLKLQLEARKRRYDVEVERPNVSEEIANWPKDRMESIQRPCVRT